MEQDLIHVHIYIYMKYTNNMITNIQYNIYIILFEYISHI